MSNTVCITGYDLVVYENYTDKVSIDKNNRKLMRFARKSGQMFLQCVLGAIDMSGINVRDTDPARMSLLFSDFINLIPDVEKLIELLNIVKNEPDELRSQAVVNAISERWSVIEVLKNVPNIPAFIACQEIGLKGVSSTELSSCAGGLLNLIDGYELIRSGKADIVFVGAASDKINPVEIPLINSLGFYSDGDYTILSGGAVVILESEDHVIMRNGKVYSTISGYQTSFSPQTYLKHQFDRASIEYILSGLTSDNDAAEDYIIGTFTKNFLREELELVSHYPLHIVSDDSFKAQSGYTFAASGLMEIIHLIKKNSEKSTIINSFGYGGQNASVLVKAPGPLLKRECCP